MARKAPTSLASSTLKSALKLPEDLGDFNERRLNSRIFRALVINYEALGEIGRLHSYLDKWTAEFPGDPYVANEARKFRTRYPRFVAPP